ncbi:zf-HC2 domain-containing protein [Eikenella corrodens]|nr:zf-HC2 domain-containing protein [Eikenella corrodens]MDU4301148.1 zf-HC2 domain-containing protein [Eikenella corrodens]
MDNKGTAMLKCQRAAELISLQHDRPLSLWERWQLRLHLLVCSPCKRYQKQLDTISLAMQHVRREQAEDKQ